LIPKLVAIVVFNCWSVGSMSLIVLIPKLGALAVCDHSITHIVAKFLNLIFRDCVVMI
jgi:hypothetical protein